jgi:hypothetical protein
VEIVLIEDRADFGQIVSSDARDFRFGAASNSQPRDRGTTQIVEGDAADSGPIARLPP